MTIENLWESIKQLLMSSFLEIVEEWLTALQDAMGNLLQSAFFIERMPIAAGTIINSGSVQTAITAMYLIGVLMLAVKLAWKGYKVWVLWRDGDSDTSPFEMLQHSIYALIVAMAFPIVYEIAVSVMSEISLQIVVAIGGARYENLLTVALNVLWPGMWGTAYGFIVLVISFVYLIIFVVLCFQMLMRGVEMFVFRMGVPIAVTGLVDSDGGVWKNYIQIFFYQLIATLIQDFLVRISIMTCATVSIGGLVLGVALLIASFRVPKMFASRLAGGNNGGGNSLHTMLLAARLFRR